MIRIQTRKVNFDFDPGEGEFQIGLTTAPEVWIRRGRLGLLLRKEKNGSCICVRKWVVNEISTPIRIENAWGAAEKIIVVGRNVELGFRYTITFEICLQEPAISWQMAFENLGGKPLWIERIALMESAAESENGGIRFGDTSSATSPAFFVNGWQSWTFSGVYGGAERERQTNLRWIQENQWYNPDTPFSRHAGRYGSDFYGVLVDREKRTGLLAGFLSQKQHYGTIEAQIKGGAAQLRIWANGDGARLDPGSVMATDWAVLYGFSLEEDDGLESYLEAVAHRHDVQLAESSPSGWCSWYHFYTGVTAQNIEENLRSMEATRERLPLKIIQIDDGYQSQVGDWREFRPTFTEGVAPLAEKIKSKGLLPGLWMAPFIISRRSKLFKTNPEFILRNRLGFPVNAGYNWGGLTTALDLTHPEALEHAAGLIHTAVHEWGFPYLKLDFLYAGGLAGERFDPTKTRAQALRGGMEAIREAAGEETFLLACGAPLGSALGLFDAMRIGADVNSTWRPRFMGVELPFRNEPHMPAVRNALQNVYTRANQHRRWWINDPDCLLVRSQTDLTVHEMQSLATAIGITGGMVFLSDHLPDLQPERRRVAEVLFPVVGQRAEVIDWFDKTQPEKIKLEMQGVTGTWYVLAVINWEDQDRRVQLTSKDFRIPDGCFSIRSFWDGDFWVAEQGRPIIDRVLPAHATLLVSARFFDGTGPFYLGGDIHFTQGAEISSWEAGRSNLRCEFDIGRTAEGIAEFHLPSKPIKAFYDNRPVRVDPMDGTRWRVPLSISNNGMLHLEW